MNRMETHMRKKIYLTLLGAALALKSLYYCRSLSMQRAESADTPAQREREAAAAAKGGGKVDYDECLACQ